MFRIARLTSVILLLTASIYPSYLLAAKDYPTIMVSIKPFYNLCARIMQDVGQPELLVKGNASPHDYYLKPSEAKLINDADLVIWGGPSIDAYLTKPIANLRDNAKGKRELDLATVPGLKILPLRTSPNWTMYTEETHSHSKHPHFHTHEHGTNDPHIWLNPENANLMADAIAQRLAQIDPAHAAIYKKNAQDFQLELARKEKVWVKQLAAYHQVPFLVLHDAYQYFNAYFQLDEVGSFTLNPEIPPSAQRIEQIQNLIKDKKVACIFGEPQFNYKIMNSLDIGNVYMGILDPLGSDDDLGSEGYFDLVDDLITTFVQCGKHAN